ncbi:PEP-CTERM sorting domain-containing protein [Opitutus terrae]|uniref:PEP-CTERM protein-sorting domain-containing protein n=1 Tax=Opitutus terrae (strain DSM 11246 / JCM 15787 / PB90-1) TaxID=452637 RepID=B1ZVR6_OPITP|nr:PEP-CTERM sorting domain-containing protein [Opitutus terrae]ACB75002.1 protein of unknown function DUF1555 [Opitutus terrae PB90-1]
MPFLRRTPSGFLLTCVMLATSGLASRSPAQTNTVLPMVNGVVNNYDQGDFGKLTVWFGYVSFETDRRYIQYGSNNFYNPEPSIRLRGPVDFFPGVHSAVFSTTFDSNVTGEWRLLGTIASANVSTDPDGDGTLSVFGSNSTITHTASRVVGTTNFELTGGGTLIIADDPFTAPIFENLNGTVRLTGSTLTASTRFDNGGTLRFEGGALDTPVLNNTGRVEFVSGTYTLPNLNNRGLLVVSGGEVSSDTALALSSEATLRLAGGKLTVTALDNTGGHVDLSGGTLVLTTQDLAVDAGGPLGDNPVVGPGARVELTTGQTDVASGHSLTLAAGASLLTQGGQNAGTVHVAGGTFESAGRAFTNQASGTFNATDATLRFTGNGAAGTDDGLQNFGTLNLLNTSVHGDVRSPAGSTINAGGSVTFDGLVSGAGHFTGGGTVTFSGGYSPGDSPALVPHAGDLVFAPGNMLTLEIGGLARGTSYDALDVSGHLTFGGTLALAFYGGFSAGDLHAGDTFDFFNWGSQSGAFGTLDLPALAGGLSWDTSQLYTSGNLSISAVPEPSTYGVLAGCACLGFAVWRRRARLR